MTDNLDDGPGRRAFVRALHESTAIADRIREAIDDAPPKLVMLALSDLLQEYLTNLVKVEPDREQTPLPKCLVATRLGAKSKTEAPANRRSARGLRRPSE